MDEKLLDEWQTVGPDQTAHFVASHLGLHCLFWPICSSNLVYHKNTKQQHGKMNLSFEHMFPAQTDQMVNMQADRSPHRKHMSAEGLSYHVVRVCGRVGEEGGGGGGGEVDWL